ncbi:MAG: thioredoxin [Oscillospiraceae bacterium]|nr:thioredoxin [Oscillospiraceae bacterium]
MAVVHIENVKDFDPEVLQASGRVLVDFWASWCAPCMRMAPVLDEIDADYPELKVVKVNVEAAQEPAVRFGIDSIPAFLLFENGKVIKKAIGAMPKDDLAKQLGL